ncbi:hypothetical protein [Streptomyces sp. NPDC020951]|uniref:hypothetical protein n=1 Tax=Streptomyces sp. NPDC020951 TaxID=3365104 RepID=UPI00379AADA6
MSNTTRLRTAWRAAVGQAAAAAGYAVRVGPGVAAPLLVSYGLWRAWDPLGYVALGAFLMLADRRMP